MKSGKSEFKQRVRDWAERLGSHVTSIAVRPMTAKWASYSTAGRVTFDESLLDCRDELQDYVIAHELLHFFAPNHGKLWKSLMRAHLGDYEQFEVELRRMVGRDKTSKLARPLPEPSRRRRPSVPGARAGRANPRRQRAR